MNEDHFPLFEVTGGPSATTLRATLDGVPIKGLTKFVLRADVNDVARLYTRQIVRFKAVIAVDPEIENEQVAE